MANDSMRSDDVLDGSVVVPPQQATPLCVRPLRVVSVTIWNLTGRNLGVGGKGLETDEHLAPGGAYTSRVRDLSVLHVWQAGPGPVRVRFTCEV